MSSDDTTRQNRISGEWSSNDCREGIHRIEKKLDRLMERHGESITSVAVLEQRLLVTEQRQAELTNASKAREDEHRSNATQVRVAVISSVSGPIIMLAIHLLMHHA